MRYLLSLVLLSISSNLYGQLNGEIGMSGGYVFPALQTERSLSSSTDKSFCVGISGDLLFGSTRPLHSFAGIRLSEMMFGCREYFTGDKSLVYRIKFTALSAVGGMQYKHSIGRNTALRFSVGAGPFYEITKRAMQNSSSWSAVGEITAGLMFKRGTIGVKFVKPFSQYGHIASDISYQNNESPNGYGISAFAIEIKVIPPEIPAREAGDRPSRGVIAELGFTGGIALINVVERGAGTPVSSGGAGLFIADFYTDKNKKPFCFTFGARAGGDPVLPMLGFVIGAQYNNAPAGNVGFRTAITAGPLMHFGITQLKPNIGAEAVAGILINQRWSLGLKYMALLFETDDVWFRDPKAGSYYRVNYLLAEAKIRLGSRSK